MAGAGSRPFGSRYQQYIPIIFSPEQVYSEDMRPGKIARLLLAGGVFAAALSGATTLSNDHVTASFTDRGLASLRDAATGATFHFSQDQFSVTLELTGAPDGKVIA